MLGPVEPLLGVREGFQNTDRFHALFQKLLETLEAGGFGFAPQPGTCFEEPGKRQLGVGQMAEPVQVKDRDRAVSGGYHTGFPEPA